MKPSLQRPYLLIVEEEPVLADVTAFRLELLGYEVQTASNGDAGWELIQQRKPDLVIVDLKLTGMPGVVFIERLAAETDTCRIPVMALSFQAEQDQVQAAFSAGASDYLVAPFDPHTLEEKVVALLRQSTASAAPAKASITGATV